MERSLIKEVNKKNIRARVTSKKVKPMYFPNFYGVIPVETLKWETLTGEKGVPVAADVISWDATAPEKTRKTVGKMSGDIPKTAIKKSMNESDWNKYKALMNSARGRSDLQSLLDIVFKDTDFVYNGVRARFEWLSMQQLSKGELMLSQTNNSGVVTAETLDFGVPSNHKRGVTVSWDDSDNATPLDDLEDMYLDARDNGDAPRYIIMREKQFLQLKKAADTIAKLKAWLNTTDKYVATLTLINNYLRANEQPTIVTVNPVIKLEDKDHNQTLAYPWEDGRVVMVPDLRVGDIQHGPIAAEEEPEVLKNATAVKQQFTLITKWAEHEPFKEWTKAEANAFPVLNDPDTLWYMRTDQANWA